MIKCRVINNLCNKLFNWIKMWRRKNEALFSILIFCFLFKKIVNNQHAHLYKNALEWKKMNKEKISII